MLNYNRSDVILRIYNDASYLSVSKARFYLSSVDPSRKGNRKSEYITILLSVSDAVHVLYQTLKNLMVSIAEVETGATFLNEKLATPLRQISKNLVIRNLQHLSK